jgi:RNA polymerase sigma-70 factor (ECF subfamily)
VLHDAALAEDAVQDGFLSAWRSAAGFDPGRGSARAWLLTLVHHRAVDLVRARRALVVHEAPGPPPERAEIADPAALDALSLRAALRRLPEEFRAPLALAYWGGLTQQECAERLQAPLGTVKSRTARALSRLHDDLVTA